jgi:LytS/YehU family sensor histidine kinase
MIIQTLAENAIKHGISAMPGPGVVNIVAQIQDGLLLVRVENSGPGFVVYPRLDAAVEPSDSGYGLKHVRERLRAHYGQAACLKFSRDALDKITTVSFAIPAVIDPEANE